ARSTPPRTPAGTPSARQSLPKTVSAARAEGIRAAIESRGEGTTDSTDSTDFFWAMPRLQCRIDVASKPLKSQNPGVFEISEVGVTRPMDPWTHGPTDRLSSPLR